MCCSPSSPDEEMNNTRLLSFRTLLLRLCSYFLFYSLHPLSDFGIFFFKLLSFPNFFPCYSVTETFVSFYLRLPSPVLGFLILFSLHKLAPLFLLTFTFALLHCPLFARHCPTVSCIHINRETQSEH